MRPRLDQRGEALAIFAAAGSGQRLGAGRPKALIEAAGLSLLARSLRNAAACGELRGAVVAAPPGHLDEAGKAIERAELDPGFGVEVVAGAGSRSESVAAALVLADAELVAVHDAARIFAPPELFAAVLATLEADPGLSAAIAAAPVSDTVKLAEDSGPGRIREVAETLERDRLWAVQTPQAFRAAALREAIAAATPEALAGAGDDAALVEANGGRVALVQADPANIKLTTAADLRVAEALLTAERG